MEEKNREQWREDNDENVEGWYIYKAAYYLIYLYKNCVIIRFGELL